MKLPNSEQFSFKDCVIAGDECWLITPKDMSTSWTDENAHFRSCIVRKSDNKIVSMGFKKFCNWGEKPDFQPWNNDWKFDAYTKIDGSLLIISKYNGELITRTRGTVSAKTLPNGHEIDGLIEKYPKVFDNYYLKSENFSILCEWTTPNNIVVLREHNEPTLTLIGMIRHDMLSYHPQHILDLLALNWNIGRPKKHSYNSVSECIKDVELWEGVEGVVIFSRESEVWPNQILKKIKASSYLELHKLATGIKNINQVLDVFMVSPKFTDPKDFYKYIEQTLDYEIAEKCKDFIEQICEAYTYFIKTEMFIRSQVDMYIRTLQTRKEQAIQLQTQFSGWKLSYAFSYLDGKEIDDKMIKKAIENTLT